jgi:hypothetical protein
MLGAEDRRARAHPLSQIRLLAPDPGECVHPREVALVSPGLLLRAGDRNYQWRIGLRDEREEAQPRRKRRLAAALGHAQEADFVDALAARAPTPELAQEAALKVAQEETLTGTRPAVVVEEAGEKRLELLEAAGFSELGQRRGQATRTTRGCLHPGDCFFEVERDRHPLSLPLGLAVLDLKCGELGPGEIGAFGEQISMPAGPKRPVADVVSEEFRRGHLLNHGWAGWRN